MPHSEHAEYELIKNGWRKRKPTNRFYATKRRR